MKKSRTVSLVLLGSAVLLSGCGPQTGGDDVEMRQNVYANRADCEKEWGQATQNCNPGSGPHAGGYVGPHYYWNHAGGYPVMVNSDGTTRALPASHIGASSASSGHVGSSARSVSISRGGFGGTAHGFSGGG